MPLSKNYYVLNIGCFSNKDIWFKKDLESFDHFFECLDIVVNKERSLWLFYEDYTVEEAFKLIMGKIDQFIRELSEGADDPIVILSFHGHGKNDLNQDWHLMLGEPNDNCDLSLTGDIIVKKILHEILHKFRTFIILNSCAAKTKGFRDITFASKDTNTLDIFKTRPFVNLPTKFGKYLYQNPAYQLNYNEVILNQYTKLTKNLSSDEKLKKWLILVQDNDILFHEKKYTKHLTIISLSSVNVSTGFYGDEAGISGTLLNLLTLMNINITQAKLWKIVRTYLHESSIDYLPEVGIHSKDINSAKEEWYNFLVPIANLLKKNPWFRSNK